MRRNTVKVKENTMSFLS